MPGTRQMNRVQSKYDWLSGITDNFEAVNIFLIVTGGYHEDSAIT